MAGFYGSLENGSPTVIAEVVVMPSDRGCKDATLLIAQGKPAGRSIAYPDAP
jgi:hypothetical protein